MMKLLFCAPFPPPLHGHSLMSQIAYKELSAKVDIIKIDTTMEREFAGNRLKSLFSLTHLWRVITTLVRDICTMQKERCSLVYLSVGITFRGFMRYSPYMLWARLKGVDYIIHTHGATFGQMYNSLSPIKRMMVKYLFSGAKSVIALSDALRPTLEVATHPSKVVACHNCVEDYLFISPSELKEKLNGENAHKILFLSNIMQAKGIFELIDAFELLPYHYTLDIAGSIEDNAITKERFEKFCARHPQRVTYHGLVAGDKKRELLCQNQIFILPSKNEGQPVSILEAYAMGLVVVSDSSVGGIGAIFTHTNGVECDHRSPDSISEAIKRASTTWMSHAHTNYQIAKKEYTQSSFSERLYNIITA